MQVGKRFHEDNRPLLCIRVILAALKAHYNLEEETLNPEVTVDGSKQRDELPRNLIAPGDGGTYGCTEETMLSPVPGLSSSYVGLGLQTGIDNRGLATSDESFPHGNGKVLMSGLLTLAQAYFDIKKFTQSSKYSKQCLSLALDFEDKEYEIKAYVKLANTYHRLANYLQAISTNAKLLAVGRDLSKADEGADLHERYWNSDVERRAVWNLSAAYKLLGNYEEALRYANEYIEVLKCTDEHNLTEAYSYLGELEVLHGNHEKALECHKVELRLCKKFNNRSGTTYAYGNIGNVYATMGNFKVASVFHEQHKSLAQALNDRVSELIAVKNVGDMHKLMGEFTKALNCYDEHLKLAKVNKIEVLQCKAYGNIGYCLWKLGQLHHAQYNFSLCLKMASELGELEEETDCKLSLAQIAKQLRQYETCRQYYNDVIPVLENKLLVREGQSADFKAQLLRKLDECYVDLQGALIEMGRPDEALEIAEHCRAGELVNVLRHRKMFGDGSQASPEPSPFSLSDIVEIVREQDSVVVLYSVLHAGFVVWLLSPDKGVVKFHHHKTCSHYDLDRSIKQCLKELHSDAKGLYHCDHRALPPTSHKKRPDLNKVPADDEHGNAPEESCNSCEFLVSDALTPLQKAYKLLLGSVDEELRALSESQWRKLVFVPDSVLNSVPYPCLQSLSGEFLHERFDVRLLPCIRALSLRSQTISSQPASSDDGCKVIVAGNPDIPSALLDGQPWEPKNKPTLAEEEITTVASLLGVDPVVGCQATKDHILSSLSGASVVHVATFGSWAEGCLAFAPNPHHHGDPPAEESFLLKASDLLQVTLKTKLVVLSACCGCGRDYCQLKQVNFALATGLLAAGVESVVLPLWSTAHPSLVSLYHHFYTALEQVSQRINPFAPKFKKYILLTI